MKKIEFAFKMDNVIGKLCWFCWSLFLLDLQRINSKSKCHDILNEHEANFPIKISDMPNLVSMSNTHVFYNYMHFHLKIK